MGFQLPGGEVTGTLAPAFRVFSGGVMSTATQLHPGYPCGWRGGRAPNGCFLIGTWVGLKFSRDKPSTGVHILLHVLVTTHEKVSDGIFRKKTC